MKLPKLVNKKECYRLSWFAWLLIALFFILLFYFIRSNIYSYLSPVKPVDTKVLVVEGWINDFAIEKVYTLFLKDHYELIITTGGPLEIGYLSTHYISAADMAKKTLIGLGMDSTKIISVPRKEVVADRTLQSAIVLKDWFTEQKSEIENFNLVSLGAHSKRSWLLFQEAMPEKEIGIIAIQDPRFDKEKWWKTSQGSRTVLTEAIGYFYVLIFM